MMQRTAILNVLFVRLQVPLLVFALLGCGTGTKENGITADEPRVSSGLQPSDATEPGADTVPASEEHDEVDDGHVVGALETYRYWAGHDPDDDMEVINGEYWSSAHWSKEYTLYLELRFPRARDFVMGRNFKRVEPWHALRDAPDWFDPSAQYELWEGQSGSHYYLHPTKGHLYIFERQF